MPARLDLTAWTDDELQEAARGTERGLIAAQLARHLNDTFHGGSLVRSVAAITSLRQRQGWGVGKPCVVRATHRLNAPAVLREEIPSWLAHFRPVALPAPQRRAASVTPTQGLTLVAGDFHFPEQDDAAVAVFLETCRLLKPQRVILNGDLPDLLAVSKYPKDVRAGKSWALGDEAKAMHGFLHELERVLPATTAIYETEANHSGNGTASRWWRYLSDAAGALVSLPDAEAKLSYQAWWYPAWSRIQLVEQVLLADDLLVLHGDVVRKHAAYSARATMEKWYSSVMHNHTHRQGSGAQAIPSIPGRAGGNLRFYETGCLCKLTPSYASAANWTQGFAIVQEGDAPREYAVELVTIQRGRAVVGALGQTLKAA